MANIIQVGVNHHLSFIDNKKLIDAFWVHYAFSSSGDLVMISKQNNI